MSKKEIKTRKDLALVKKERSLANKRDLEAVEENFYAKWNGRDMTDIYKSNVAFAQSRHRLAKTDFVERLDSVMSVRNAYLSYCLWCSKNPIMQNEVIKGGAMAGEVVQTPLERPVTLSGFCSYVGISKVKWNTMRKSDEMGEICALVEESINANLLEKGLVNQTNPILTAKVLKIDDEVVDKGSAINVNIAIGGVPMSNTIELAEDVSDQ